MKYVSGTFTLPAANSKTTGLNWDLAFLDHDAFKDKYGITPTEYCNGKQRTQ